MKKIGIYYWFGFEIKPCDRIKIISDVGFSCLSVWGDSNFSYPSEKRDEIEWNRLPEYASEAGIEIENVHIPFYNSHSVWQEREAFDIYLKEIKNSVDYCHRHQIPTGVLHIPKILSDDMAEIGIERVKEIISYAEDKDVNIALENLRNSKALELIFSHVSSEKLGFCYDSGHQRCWETNTDFLGLYKDKLMAVHLDDNNGSNDKHDIPFDGRCRWKEIGDTLKNYKGSLMLEVTSEKSRRYKKMDVREFLDRAFKAGVRLGKIMENFSIHDT